MAAVDSLSKPVILFDAVGTLIYPRPSVAEVYAAAGRRFGSQLSSAEIKQRFGPALARSEQGKRMLDEPGEMERWGQIVAEVFNDVADSSALFRELWEHFADGANWAVFDDVAPMWKELSARGYRIGIASNFDVRLERLCRQLPPLNTCECLYYSSQLGYAKPQPGFFKAIAARLPPSFVPRLLVGDDPIRDIAGATKAGWQARLIDRSGHYQPNAVLSDLRQLLDELP